MKETWKNAFMSIGIAIVIQGIVFLNPLWGLNPFWVLLTPLYQITLSLLFVYLLKKCRRKRGSNPSFSWVWLPIITSILVDVFFVWFIVANDM